jgi:hypothetical protein
LAARKTYYSVQEIDMQLSAFLFITALPLLASDPSRPSFSGTWHLDPASSQIHSRISNDLVWTIDQQEDGIHFLQSGAGAALDVTCGTRGADCKTKEAGKPVTVSFWFNGPALVQMETEGKGEAITKRKMQLSGDGSSMIVEVTHIVPEGRSPEKYVLKKQH